MAAAGCQVSIPPSETTVDVYVIDTSYFYNTPGPVLVEPIYSGYERLTYPSYSFLIHHKPDESRILFDLGIRANYQTHFNPKLLEEVKPLNLTIDAAQDVADVLQEDGLPLERIDHIVFSHHHWDHTGDTTKFPASTSLVVGPGYKKEYLPGWPIDLKSTATTSDLYEGRKTIELDFSPSDPKTCSIGEYRAYDWFGDGSLYILDTVGHTIGHLCVLARTTGYSSDSGSTFVFMGGDIAHHGSLFRPTKAAPLPEAICPAPYEPPDSHSSCPGEIYASAHRLWNPNQDYDASYTSPFCVIPTGYVQKTPGAALQALEKMHVFDADQNILTIVAHDHTLKDIIDYYPNKVNEWKAKDWGSLSHWRFLADLKVDGNKS